MRYVNVTNDNGSGLQFEAAQNPFEMSVLPYSAYELENALHQEELPCSNYTWVRIAACQRGVGGDDSWGAPVRPQYELNCQKNIKIEFYIKEID